MYVREGPWHLSQDEAMCMLGRDHGTCPKMRLCVC